MTDPPVFVVTTGRTGSTLLSQMLRTHPEVLSLSEMLSSLTCRALTDRSLTGATYLRYLTVQGPFLRALYSTGIRQREVLFEPNHHGALALQDVPPLALVTLPFLGDRPLALIDALAPLLRERGAAGLENHMRFLFDWLARHFGKAVCVERSGDSLLFSQRLAEMFADARFVHLHRDGRDVALSMSDHPDFRAKVSYCRQLHRLGINPFRSEQAYGVARWHAWLEAVLVRILPVRVLAEAEVGPINCAWYWGRSTSAGLEMLDALEASRVHHLAYEDLTREPQRVLRSLADFIGVGAPEDWLGSAAALADIREPRWRRLPLEPVSALEQACGASLIRLGYVEAERTSEPPPTDTSAAS